MFLSPLNRISLLLIPTYTVYFATKGRLVYLSSLLTLLCLFHAAQALFVDVEDEQVYCDTRYTKLCHGKGVHVGCQYPEPGPGESCVNYTAVNFNEQLKFYILHYINRRRQKIADGHERGRGGVPLPQPEIMMFVDWDRELSSLAQRLADQCLFAHDECRATVRYPYAGQACGEVRWRKISGTIDVTATKAIRRVLDAWWGERRKVDPNQLVAPFRITNKSGSEAWGHFSQMAVWTLRAVGCGAVIHGVDSARLLLVCDFSHTNMLGQKTLKPGPLAPCPYNTVRKANSPYYLLCTNVRHITSDDDIHNVYRGPVHTTTTESNVEVYDRIESTETDKIQETEVTSPTYNDNDEKVSCDDRIEDSADKDCNDASNEDDSDEMMDDDMIIVSDEVVSTHAVQPRRTTHTVEMTTKFNIKTTLSMFQTSKQTTESLQTQSPDAAVVHMKPINKDTSEHRRQRLENVRAVQFTSAEMKKFQEQHQRHKWHNTRSRHERPGAKALLQATMPIVQSTRRWSSVKVTLMMDKEDIEQLFRDTGFSIKWKNNYYN